MMRLLKRAGAAVFDNFVWKLASLGVAIVIWVLVASEPEVGTYATVRLQYNHLPANLEIGSDPVESVLLELKGPAGELRGTGDGMRSAVVIDVAGVGAGPHTFTISERNVRLAPGVRLVRAIPLQVRLMFEPHVQRSVPVEVRWTALAPAEFLVMPQSVTIEGPRSHVLRVAAAVTDAVDPASVGQAKLRVNLTPFPADSYVRFQSRPEAVVDVRK